MSGASAVLLGGSDQQKNTLLPKVVDGSEILTLAVDDGPRHAPAQIRLSAEKSGSGHKLNGGKTFVLEGMAATTLIVAARTSGNAGDQKRHHIVYGSRRRQRYQQKTALQTVDSRGYAQIQFNNVEVGADAVFGTVDQGHGILEATLDRARAGLGAEMLGTAAQAFDMTLDYLKTREQFGKVIGSFQALGHRAADLFSAMELARSCAEGALIAIDEGDDNIPLAVSLSKAKVGDFLHEMSNQLIQIHGGIGMTDEFDAGFYLKRARVLETTYGNQAYHRDRYAKLMGY